MILGKPHSTAPQWADVFIAELEATGNVSAAARAAGVTPGAAYNRRTRIPGFAARWEWALETASRSSPVQAVPLPHRPEGMIVAARGCGGAKLVRSSRKTWTEKAEEGFLGELGASADVARAAGWTEAEEGVFVPPGWVRVEEAVCAGCGLQRFKAVTE